MRSVHLLVAGLLAVGTLLCHSAWALPGDAALRVHATPLHSHATPGHAHDGGESAADPCDPVRAVNAPSVTVAAPQTVAPVADVPALDAVQPVRTGPPLAPGSVAHLWGYNGSSPGPTIEVVEGDRVRIYVTNRLPEHTSIHWHGQRLPNGRDGVTGLTQPAIPAGKTYRYEFVARRPGTFMYPTPPTRTRWCRWPWG